MVDYYFIRKKEYDITQFQVEDGPYWYWKGINPAAIVCFLLGVATYFAGQQLPFIMSTIGAVFFCFLVTGLLYFVSAKLLHKPAK